MANFKEIDEARRLLGLGETATLEEVKQAYTKMAFRYHPDRSRDSQDNPQGEQVMKKLNWAYKLLRDYCAQYKYSFREEDVGRTYPLDEYLRKYYYEWFEGI